MIGLVIIGGCQGCGACLSTCPEHALRPARGTVTVLAQRCTGCGECIEVCPADAITGTWPGFRAGMGGRQDGPHSASH